MRSIAGFLADGLIWALEMILDLTFETMNFGLMGVASYASISPSAWANGRPWELMMSIQRVAVVPIAAIFLTYVMCMELISLVMDKNNFHEVEITSIIKIIFKMSIGVILVNNSVNLVSGAFALGTNLISHAMGSVNLNSSGSLVSAEAVIQMINNDPACEVPNIKLSFVAILFVIALLSFLVSFGVQAIAYMTVYTRLYEIILYSVFAPMPMSTLMNSKWSDVGTNYIRNMLALGVQGFLIIFILAIYSLMLSGTAFAFDMTNYWTFLSSLLMRLIAGLVLGKMLMSSGQITKSIFSAH